MEYSWVERLKTILTVEEDERDKAYDCGTGKEVKATIGFLTIGVGRNLEANGLSKDEIQYLLGNDIEKALDSAYQIFGNEFDKYTQERQHALVSMIFQLGATGFLKFKKMVAAIKAGSWVLAGDEAIDSKWAREDTPKRAHRTRQMLSFSTYPYEYFYKIS